MVPPPVAPGSLAGRIQGFGNVNPPPIEEEDGKAIAKRAVGRLGDLVGEEVMLTVEDFREKGAVRAVGDAVLDAGDLLVDGVSGVFGWLRGDPPPAEEADEEKDQAAQKALTMGPGGAAYGVSQASPTGGINAVWVMPEEADPATMAQLAAQQAPANVQPYQQRGAPQNFNNPMQIPGGPAIAPYQAPGSSIPGGPAIQPYQPRGAAPPPFVPGAGAYTGGSAGFPGAMPGQFPGAGAFPGAPGGFGAPQQPPSGLSRVKALIDSVVKGEVIVGPEVAKRLLSQCSAASINASKLGELLCETSRRLYLGLDGSPDKADGSLARILALTDALAQCSDNALARGVVHVVAAGASEELLSLKSSAAHRAAAEPMLRRVGLIKGAPAQEVDLLGESAPSSSGAQSSDLLGGDSVDLLGGGGSAPASSNADLLGF